MHDSFYSVWLRKSLTGYFITRNIMTCVQIPWSFIGQPCAKNDLSLKATWYSGKLRIPTGAMTLFADNAYDSRYSREVIITVTKGDVERVVTLDSANQKLTVDEGNTGKT